MQYVALHLFHEFLPPVQYDLINAAENMLLFSSHDISFIAREVGYTDCSYFIRCYKKLKGITPKQARKLQLGR